GGLELLALADVGGEGDHLAAVGVLQPLEDHRGVEATGIREDHLPHFAHLCAAVCSEKPSIIRWRGRGEGCARTSRIPGSGFVRVRRGLEVAVFVRFGSRKPRRAANPGLTTFPWTGWRFRLQGGSGCCAAHLSTGSVAHAMRTPPALRRAGCNPRFSARAAAVVPLCAGGAPGLACRRLRRCVSARAGRRGGGALRGGVEAVCRVVGPRPRYAVPRDRARWYATSAGNVPKSGRFAACSGRLASDVPIAGHFSP